VSGRPNSVTAPERSTDLRSTIMGRTVAETTGGCDRAMDLQSAVETEWEVFEPSRRVNPAYAFSNRAASASRTPLHAGRSLEALARHQRLALMAERRRRVQAADVARVSFEVLLVLRHGRLLSGRRAPLLR